jgi:putative ABC transport system permease protein
MNKFLFRNMFRELMHLKGRFLALFMILALSAGFYIGFSETDPLMTNTADDYFKNTHLADFRLLSDYGITDEDIDALRGRDEIYAIMPSYDADIIGTKNADTKNSLTYSIHSLPINVSEDNKDYLSRVTLTKGRMPAAGDECLVSDLQGTKIGDTVTVNSDNSELIMERLKYTQFTVVGIAKSAQYISIDLGNTNIGDGLIDDFMYLPNESFDSEIYTAVYLSLKDTQGLSAFSEEYAKIVADEMLDLTAYGDDRSEVRYVDILEMANEELAKGEKEYAEGKAEADKGLSEARTLLENGRKELEAGRKEFAEKLKEFNAGEKKINDGKALLAEKKAEVADGKEKLADGASQLKDAREQLSDAKAELADGEAKIKDGEKELADGKAEYAASKADYESLLEQSNGRPSRLLEMMKAELDAAYDKILAGEKELANGKKEYAKGLKEYTSGQKKYEKALKEYNKAKKILDDAPKALADGQKEIDAGEKELAAAKILLDEGRAKISAGARELADGEKEYAEKKADIDAQLADAEKQIANGKNTIQNLPPPVWYVFDRGGNSEYSGFKDSAGRMKALALTMPVFMYLIAALICVTTIARMIEEDRLQIGTLKALGYRRRQVLLKYLLYAGSVGILGGIAGVLLGLQIFPRAIWRVYSSFYTFGDVKLSYGLEPIFIGIFVGTIIMLLTALITCFKELNSSAAMLMRPKAPPAGKRVLIERISTIWNRLSFTGKVTARNAFRYKQRFVAAVVGVIGCMGLLATGFGLNDSISQVVDLQYGKVMQAEITVLLNKPGSEAVESPLNEKLGKYGDYMYLYENTIEATKGSVDASSSITYLCVPEYPEKLHDFMSLHDRKSGKKIDFPLKSDAKIPSVVVTEKLTQTLGLNKDDVNDANTRATITFGMVDEKKVVVNVGAIAENYFNNYVFITGEGFQKLYGNHPEYNTVMLKTPKMTDAEQKEMLTDLVETDGVLSAYSTDQARDTINNMLDNFGAVIWIIVISASLLAIIVLYSLANINVIERTKELATLKVLGFFKKEIYSYIVQENLLLTVIGIVFGIPVGIYLHKYVVTAVEGVDIMLVHSMSWFSLVLAGVFTLISMIIVNLLMRPGINRIDPALSLKSIQ